MLDERIKEAVRILWMSAEYEKGAKAMALLEEAAAEGNGDAYFFLARCVAGPCYVAASFGFKEDDDQCDEYLDKSIELGSAIGMFGARRFGSYVDKGGSYLHAPYESNAQVWDAVYEMAQAGDAFMQYMVGNAYYYGDCIELLGVDIERMSDAEGYRTVMKWMDEAEKWYEKSIQQGCVQTIGNYINMLTSGDYGRPKNPDKAFQLKETAAKAGISKYAVEVGIHYALTEPDKAIGYLEDALNRGDKEAYYGLGLVYGVSGKRPDLVRSNAYLEEGLKADARAIGCKNRLGENYFYGGYGITADPAKAFSYLKDLEADNNWGSPFRGMCYLRGWGVAQNYEKARQQLDIYNGDKLNAVALGEIYAYGLGVPVNVNKAMTYWDRFPNDPEVIEHKKNFKKGLFGWKRINK